MKNFVRSPIFLNGSKYFQLIHINGEIDQSFSAFIEHLLCRSYAPETIRRYLNIVACFLDYLSEISLYPVSPSKRYISKALDRYVPLKLNANRLRRIDKRHLSDPFIAWGAPLVASLGIRQVGSTNGIVSAVRHYLALSDQFERALNEGSAYDELSSTKPPVSEQIQFASVVSRPMPGNSMLSGVLRRPPTAIDATRSQHRDRVGISDERYKDFPIGRFPDLLQHANSWRDRFLWALLGASGLRVSEACALQWGDVDIPTQTIIVLNPNNRPGSKDGGPARQLRFKGRTTQAIFLLPELKSEVFRSMYFYLAHECQGSLPSDYVFQDIRPGKSRGRPFYDLSDAARTTAFHRACERASIPQTGVKSWAPHSLRHMYGVFLTNYLPVPGGFGLRLEEVQRLMGHASDRATRTYARQDEIVLEAKLELADRIVMGGGALDDLPRTIADRLRLQANLIDGSVK
ncbi:tyrosine-type recombinase/integrase [Sphingomonas sp. AX6]|uniref:tyrosine-type recombinase/integrase n=1 Tax=Sphingomonas sp. AX6 TaxID=2653171 RepID=UPI0012F20C1E|nr:conserved hypothetical protein [Sphingomonas sp. AX6]